MVIWTLVFCAVATLLGLLYWLPRRRMWALAKQFPGPKPYPIVGNILMFWGYDGNETFQLFRKLYRQYGPTFGFWVSNYFMVCVTHPDDIPVVLRNAKVWNRPALFSDIMTPSFGDGLLTNRDEEWKSHRKIFQSAFHYKILDNYVEVFEGKTRTLLKRLDEVADGRTIDLFDYLASYALDAICETAIGASMDAQNGGRTMFEKSVDINKRLLRDKLIKPWLLIDWIFGLTNDGAISREIRKTGKAFAEEVITKKLEDYRNGERRPGINTSTGKTVNSFLDMMIEVSETQGSILTPQQMQDETITMAMGGFDTTATAMSFLLLHLAIHPEVQQQVAEEMDAIFDGYDDAHKTTPEDLLRMTALECAIKETLRLISVIPFMPREINDEIALPSGYTLPIGSLAVVSVYAIHRNEEFFPEPDKYKPERWLPENAANIRPNTFLPFATGPRDCVGRRYAMLEMKTALSAVIRRYKITTKYTMEYIQDNIELSITLAMPPGNYLVSLERRRK